MLGKSGAGKIHKLSFPSSPLSRRLPGLPRCKNELQVSLTSHNAPSGVSDVLSMLGYVAAQMSNVRGSGQRGGTSGRLGLKASEVGPIPLVVAIDEPGASSSFCRNKRKAQLVALLTQQSCVAHGVILL